MNIELIFQSVFCGHEYTVKNLDFSLSIEPQNKNILSKMKEIKAKRKIKLPSVPSTIGNISF